MKKFLLAITLCIITINGSADTRISDHFGKLDIEAIQLGSASAAVVAVNTGSILYMKNARAVMSIASITKLMTAMVVLDSGLPLDEMITVTRADLDTLKNTYSRIRFGTRMSRRNALRLALMSSENRAASALGRHYPGGITGFVAAMNEKAAELGMTDTHFADSSGLNPDNVSTASDLVKMVRAASGYDLIHEFTTQAKYTARFRHPRYTLRYVNTNPLVRRGEWDIALSKTGFIDEAGRCLVMLTEVDGRQVAMVMLDSFGKYTPVGDAGRIKEWINTGASGDIARAALRYERVRTAEIEQMLAVQEQTEGGA